MARILDNIKKINQLFKRKLVIAKDQKPLINFKDFYDKEDFHWHRSIQKDFEIVVDAITFAKYFHRKWKVWMPGLEGKYQLASNRIETTIDQYGSNSKDLCIMILDPAPLAYFKTFEVCLWFRDQHSDRTNYISVMGMYNPEYQFKEDFWNKPEIIKEVKEAWAKILEVLVKDGMLIYNKIYDDHLKKEDLTNEKYRP